MAKGLVKRFFDSEKEKFDAKDNAKSKDLPEETISPNL